MFKPKIALGAAALLVSVGTLTVINPRNGEAQIGSTPVRVVNTPLPVSGNVNAVVTGDVNATVNGNVNATVSGNVGLAAGATVGLSGPVTIGNPASDPVLVRDVDGSGGFVRLNYTLVMPDGSQGVAQNVYTVPPGKVFVVEHASARWSVPAGQKPMEYILASSIPSGSYWDLLVPNAVGNYGGYDEYIYNQETRMYIYENNTLAVSVFRNAGSGSTATSGFISGRLVPMP